MSKTKLLTIAFCLTLFSNLFSQKGKDGAKSILAATSIKINEFTALTANASTGNTIINVTLNTLNANSRFSGALVPGDLIMIIQMQGALIKLNPYNPWETYVTDSLYGQIYGYQTCGNYEFAEVKSVISTNQIELTCGLKNNYSSAGKTQIVRVPRYNALTVANTGTLTTDAWNGTIGGVLVAEVDGNTTVNGGGLITATGLGFRGGSPIASGGNNFYPTSYMTGTNNGSEKGEGVGSDRLTNLVDSVGKYCKGAPGNAGGGGNANNCGGGGGGNGGAIGSYNGYGIPNLGGGTFTAIWNLEWPGRASVTSSGGGKGGYGTSTTTTANINSIGPNSTSWGSFKRLSAGGFGGRPLDYSTGRIFMGGGGGAGHTTVGQSNGAGACAGGAGGGLIFLLNYGTISGTGSITSNGANGGNAYGTANIGNPQQGIDGAGGAGAGGTIILESNGAISGITASANGGNGGNQVKSGTANSEGQGPGGGGSGGYIAGNGSVFTQNTNGGANGTTNATAFDTEFPMNGATSGDVGTNNQVIAPAFSLTASANQTLCTNQSATVTATSTNGSATIEWYNGATGGTAIATGTVYTTPTYTATGTYTVYAASCPGIYRVPIVLTVGSGATITVNSPTICPGQTVTLTASGATTYTWNTGPTTNTISVSPASTTSYTVNATSGSCTGTQTTQVVVSSTPTISVASATICSGNSATLTASGATSYTWMPGGQTTTSVVVTPTTNTTYTITGVNGSCTGTTTAAVSITSTPTLSTSSKTICAGQVATFTVSGATTYTWNPGGVTGSTYTTSPASSGTVSVIGANGTCTSQVTTSVTVTPNPTVAVSNQTICPTQTVTLTASGATTYSWNTGATTNTISVSPASTTVYTVTGTSSLCSNTQTVSVTLASQPTVAVANASICSGNSTTLTASGATNYTWMPGGLTTSTISVSPGATTIYTITGATGTCTNSTNATVNVTNTPTLSTSSKTICAGQVATFTVSGATTYTWNPGGVTGSTYTTSPASSGTVSVIGTNGTCTSQVTTSVTVTPNPTVAVSNQTICPTQTVTLTASGATTYSWNTGATTNTISVSPGSTTVYTVTGTSSLCLNTQTVSVTVASQPTVAVTNASICSGNSTTLTASGATNYTWMPGGQLTSTVSVSPASTTIYTITGSNGTCTNTTTATVNVTSTPTLVANSATICPAQTATLTASGATTYTWNPGAVTGSTYTIAPASNTTVSIIGANGTCTTSATVSVTIGSGISIAVNNPTICVGQTATLTASGATSYTWNTGPNTNTLSVSPASSATYTISGTSGACSGSNTAVVTVVSAPSLTVANASICSGGTATLTASGATNYTWMPGGQTTPSITDNPSSTTVYTITGDNGVCTNSTTATVSVTATPTLAVASTTICPGQTATLTASGATSYTWNPGAVTGSTYTMSPASNTVVTIDGANGTCTSSTTASITIGSGLSITVNSSTICPGQTATLTANGAVSYTWNPGNLSGSTVTVSPLSSTTYTVDGANGACTGSNTAVVAIAATPTLIASASTTICATQTATLTASGATTYTWNPGNLSGATVALTPTTNTTYTVVGSNGSCLDSTTTSVTLINCNNPCQFSLGRDTAFCSPMNYTINGPAGYNSYSWTPGGATTQSITATNTGTYVLTANMLSNDLVVNGDFTAGNTGFASVYTVPVVPGPFGLLSNPGTYLILTSPNAGHTNFYNFGDHTTGTGNMMVCNGASNPGDIVWTETITVSPNTNYNFSAWVASTENTSAAGAAQLQFSINSSLIGPVYPAPLTGGVWSNFAVNWNSGVSTSAVITIVDQNTAAGGNDFALDDIFFQQICSYSDTIIVTENVTPTLTVSATNSVICNGNSTTLTASGASTYTWTGGVTNGTVFSPTTTATYSVLGTSVAGCTNSAVQSVTVNSLPTVSVTSANICSGQTATLTASGANTYTWSNSANGSSQTVSPVLTGTYSVTGTDVNGCVSVSAATSTVNVSATPTISINTASICAGQTATLTATGATNYTWSTTQNMASINVTPANTTTYSVVGDNGGCASGFTTTVIVTPSPTLTVSSPLPGGCAPFCTNFIDAVSASATGITYAFGDGTTGNTNDPSHCYTTGGNYTVTATVTNSVLGCSNTFTLPITVITQAVADFNITEGNIVTVGNDVHLINASSNADGYIWNVLCSGQTSISTDLTVNFADTGSCCINLIADRITGCSDTVQKCITIVKEAVVVIPNVFTPNGDGKNDVFKVNSSGLKSLDCTIFDRWGLKMYEWNGINGYWDGNAKSGPAPDGTYFYIINYTDQLDKTTTEKGYLNLFQN